MSLSKESAEIKKGPTAQETRPRQARQGSQAESGSGPSPDLDHDAESEQSNHNRKCSERGSNRQRLSLNNPVEWREDRNQDGCFAEELADEARYDPEG